MSSEKYTNLRYLKELSNGSNEFISQMITVFMEQTPQALDTIDQCFQSRDWKALAATAHKIKPSFSFMGINELENLVPQIEESCLQQTDLDLLPEKIGRLKNICHEAMAELAQEKLLYQ